jgi:octaprenyl-diphosphate synthase
MKSSLCSKRKIEEVYQRFEEKLIKVEKNIYNYLKLDDLYLDKIIQYIDNFKGKRLRPLLVLICASLNGEKSFSKEIELATCFEIIHTATLIHDDVIDEASIRRFNPTLNYSFGNSISVISGDYLFSKAILILIANFNQKILKVIARVINLVCEGEMRQHQRQFDDKLTLREYLEIIELKTASLFAACCKSASLMVGRREEEIIALERYGLYLGKAYQIIDDCMDITSNEENLGKSVGRDLSKGRLTLPVIRLLEKRKIKDIFNINRDRLLSLLKEEGCLEDAYQRARNFIMEGKRELEKIENLEVKSYLETLAEYIGNRNII